MEPRLVQATDASPLHGSFTSSKKMGKDGSTSSDSLGQPSQAISRQFGEISVQVARYSKFMKLTTFNRPLNAPHKFRRMFSIL